jgi:4-hydroxybenzoate polyprenyltransferase
VNATKIPEMNLIFYWVGGFALFAFLTTLTREIIKDIEDFEGDVAYGRNTIPVVIGVLSSKVASVSLIIITIILLFVIWYNFINDFLTFIYLTVAIVLPLSLVIYKLIISRNLKQLHSASSIMKIVMLTGILYSVLVKIIFTWDLF